MMLLVNENAYLEWNRHLVNISGFHLNACFAFLESEMVPNNNYTHENLSEILYFPIAIY